MITPDDITDEQVDAVEEALGWCSGAWDMMPPKAVIAAAVNAITPPDDGEKLTEEWLKTLGRHVEHWGWLMWSMPCGHALWTRKDNGEGWLVRVLNDPDSIPGHSNDFTTRVYVRGDFRNWIKATGGMLL